MEALCERDGGGQVGFALREVREVVSELGLHRARDWPRS